MPFYLTSFTGGLGNQLFQLLSLYTLAKKYGTTFSVDVTMKELSSPFFTNKIPIYINTVFQDVLASEYYIQTITHNPDKYILLNQFDSIPSLDAIDCKINVIFINGLLMNTINYISEIDSIRSVLYTTKLRYIPLRVSNLLRPRICIACRTFSSEKHNEWSVNEMYYQIALSTLISELNLVSMDICFFTDDENIQDTIIYPLLSMISDCDVHYNIKRGSRDNHIDVEHFFDMFDCDHFILCNSTYHYWPALLSTYNLNKRVFFPSKTRDGKNMDWFKQLCPINWICI